MVKRKCEVSQNLLIIYTDNDIMLSETKKLLMKSQMLCKKFFANSHEKPLRFSQIFGICFFIVDIFSFCGIQYTTGAFFHKY